MVCLYIYVLVDSTIDIPRVKIYCGIAAVLTQVVPVRVNVRHSVVNEGMPKETHQAAKIRVAMSYVSIL